MAADKSDNLDKLVESGVNLHKAIAMGDEGTRIDKSAAKPAKKPKADERLY